MIDWSLNLFSCVWRIKATPGKKILASFRCSQIGNYESNLSTSFPASLTWPPALIAALTTSPSPLETLLRWKKKGWEIIGEKQGGTSTRYCGKSPPAYIESLGEMLEIEFHTNQVFVRLSFFEQRLCYLLPNFQPEMSPPSVVKALKSLKMWLCLTNQVQVSGMTFAFRSCHHHTAIIKINLQLKNRVTPVVGLLWTTQLLPRYVQDFIISSDS